MTVSSLSIWLGSVSLTSAGLRRSFRLKKDRLGSPGDPHNPDANHTHFLIYEEVTHYLPGAGERPRLIVLLGRSAVGFRSHAFSNRLLQDHLMLLCVLWSAHRFPGSADLWAQTEGDRRQSQTLRFGCASWVLDLLLMNEEFPLDIKFFNPRFKDVSCLVLKHVQWRSARLLGSRWVTL